MSVLMIFFSNPRRIKLLLSTELLRPVNVVKLGDTHTSHDLGAAQPGGGEELLLAGC